MEKNTKRVVALALNIVVFLMMVLSVTLMIFGINFMGKDVLLSTTGWEIFKFFTVDSNVLMGVIAAIYVVYLALFLDGKIARLPRWLSVLKLVGTVGVSLTFLTVVAFLAPFVAPTYWSLFVNAQLFMHLLTPVVSIVTFVFFEDTDDIRLRETLWGMLPMVVYSIFYMTTAFTHIVDGKVPYQYDWYAFVQLGLWQIAVSLPVMLGATYLISWLLWLGNRGVYKAGQKRLVQVE